MHRMHLHGCMQIYLQQSFGEFSLALKNDEGRFALWPYLKGSFYTTLAMLLCFQACARDFATHTHTHNTHTHTHTHTHIFACFFFFFFS
jgi:hypothetical protein